MLVLFSWLLGALSVAVILEHVASFRSRRRHAPPGLLIELAGRRWHVQCSGEDTPMVVFESGIAASSISWSRVQPLVASFTRTWAHDRAGYAWSDPSPLPRTAGQQTRELHDLLSAAGAAPPWVIVGHSFGALIAILLAHRHAEHVAGVVLVDPLPPAEWSQPGPTEWRTIQGGILFSRVGEWLARVGIVRLLLTLLALGAHRLPRLTLRSFGPSATAAVERVVGEVQKLPVNLLPAVRAHWSGSRSFATMARHFGALVSSSREAATVTSLGDLPLVVIAGAHQDGVGLERQRALARLSSRGELVMASHGRHWVHLDDPDLVARVVQDVVMQARARKSDW
jgi:pimeloyl-ACP methyl ester carboxylesterase